MNSNILNRVGLGGLDAGYIVLGMLVLIVLMLIILIVQVVKVNRLKKRMNRFMLGKNSTSLEQDIISLYEDNKFLKAGVDRNKKDIRILYKNFESAYQKMGLVKYDAFNQMGGQLSFSLALLNENNDGFIMNSVHSTDGCYSYTKEVRGGKSEISLGKEEEEALAIAMNN